jgi:hypothetical protein
LVTGIKENIYHCCSVARDYETMCGKEGKQYVRKYHKRTTSIDQTRLNHNKGCH